MVSLQKANFLPKNSSRNLESAVKRKGRLCVFSSLLSILISTITGPWQTASRGSCRQPALLGWLREGRTAASPKEGLEETGEVFCGTESRQGASGVLPGGGGFDAEKGRALN